MNRSELLDVALKLNVRARAELADQLLQSLDQLSRAELENLWLDEALRRDEAVQQERLKTVPAGELLAELKAQCD